MKVISLFLILSRREGVLCLSEFLIDFREHQSMTPNVPKMNWNTYNGSTFFRIESGRGSDFIRKWTVLVPSDRCLLNARKDRESDFRWEPSFYLSLISGIWTNGTKAIWKHELFLSRMTLQFWALLFSHGLDKIRSVSDKEIKFPCKKLCYQEFLLDILNHLLVIGF